MMAWRLVSKLYETIGMKGECSVSFCRTLQTYQASKSFFEKFNERHCCQLQAGFLTATSVRPDWVRISIPGHRTQLALMRTTLGNARALNGFGGSSLFFQRHVNTKPYQIGNSDNIAPQLNRGFFVQLWVLDKKTKHSSEKRRRLKKHGNSGQVAYDDQIPLQRLAERWLSGQSTPEEEAHSNRKVLHQPPPSQSATGFLKPSSREEALVFPLLARANLLISRDIEWANLVLGFEQENRYAIVDVCYPEAPVGYIREQSNVLARQFLRLRRPFVAYIIDGLGNELFRVRRPFWWITSSIYAEIDGKEVGVVHRRWHLWRRIYDLYLGNKQFAVVENLGFWNWTFTLKDIDGEVLAQIDRDWRGFGFEIFTDAGQYVIRFGNSDSVPKSGPARKIEELEVSRPLTLSERAVAVALAISLDNDYFSRHGGWGLPFVAVGE